MSEIKNEGIRRLAITIAIVFIVVFFGTVIKTHWDLEAVCNDINFNNYEESSNTKIVPKLKITPIQEKHILQKFFDEEIITLGCRISGSLSRCPR